MNQQDRPEISKAGIVYGDLVYWTTIVASVIVLLGSIITFVTDANYIDPTYLLASIWEGETVAAIWEGAVGSRPDGHWYMAKLATGNGLTAAGIALGVFSIVPAIIGSGIMLLRDRKPLFAVLAFVAALITIGSML